ncbi:phosphatase [Solibaculum mannosilyticum]|uniref:phosphatase n=1 Tax=Solibaculum mannosilyticum TaxID=2780922 RepID=UPI0007A7FF14|nr:phosphatase [[Clostridium] leptum]CZT55562.1 putative phosphatase YcdX [Eubacteriaceae bacterium CHKCI005]
MKLEADLHVHTLASSHAYSTITEIARWSADIGLKAVAITDHGSAMPDAPHIWHFQNLDTIPDHLFGVHILRGVEANVMDPKGSLDIEEWILKKLDWVVASMHKQTALMTDPDEVTSAWMGIAENPYVDVIGHMGLPRYACDYDKVVRAFGEHGKLVEINSHSFDVRKEAIPNCRKVAELCMKYGVQISVDSDAHFHMDVAKVDKAMAMLKEIDFPEELIVNASYERLVKYLENRNRPKA